MTNTATRTGPAGSTATRRPGFEVQRKMVLAAAGAMALLAVLFALAWLLDQHNDRQRPMYRDVLTLAWLEHDHLRSGAGDVVPVQLGPGESTTVDGERFTTSPGVTVRVRSSGQGFCVRGRNAYGDVTAWQCADRETQPPPLGALSNLG